MTRDPPLVGALLQEAYDAARSARPARSADAHQPRTSRNSNPPVVSGLNNTAPAAGKLYLR
ncbi:hypothetical protein XM50_05500 [Sphingomonas sp. Ag1]|nr:hypothetical protein XM50_05500 [Sphingomonas sp. Ag1]